MTASMVIKTRQISGKYQGISGTSVLRLLIRRVFCSYYNWLWWWILITAVLRFILLSKTNSDQAITSLPTPTTPPIEAHLRSFESEVPDDFTLNGGGGGTGGVEGEEEEDVDEVDQHRVHRFSGGMGAPALGGETSGHVGFGIHFAPPVWRNQDPEEPTLSYSEAAVAPQSPTRRLRPPVDSLIRTMSKKEVRRPPPDSRKDSSTRGKDSKGRGIPSSFSYKRSGSSSRLTMPSKREMDRIELAERGRMKLARLCQEAEASGDKQGIRRCHMIQSGGDEALRLLAQERDEATVKAREDKLRQAMERARQRVQDMLAAKKASTSNPSIVDSPLPDASYSDRSESIDQNNVLKQEEDPDELIDDQYDENDAVVRR